MYSAGDSSGIMSSMPEDADDRTLGRELRTLRGTRSLRELGQLLGISHSVLGNYETSRRTPDSLQLAKILDALEVEPAER